MIPAQPPRFYSSSAPTLQILGTSLGWVSGVAGWVSMVIGWVFRVAYRISTVPGWVSIPLSTVALT